MNAVARHLHHDAAPTKPKIGFEGVDVAYPTPEGGRIPVVSEASFAVGKGEFVSIVGPSGCGKSTVLRVLSGLLAHEKGTVRINGRSLEENRERIGFMFQRDTLLPWASVADNIRIGAELANIAHERRDARVAELIGFLRLSGFEKHRPHQLSGGMRQRVALGRLLAFEPHIYLLDEPFGALDAQTKIAMGRELLRVWSEYKRSVIFVTHDIEEAVTLSDRVLVMSPRPGHIVRDIAVDLPRPRDPKQLRKDARFADLVDAIWSELDAGH
ncbi:ABC transporter ATP-binding protein [Mesorhizobium sp. RP14(2022)]|uniref:ABC transporter ATP-binding protein n=1 Tax=Mesorhizobium liriopis TaxID=2953882 RepID=A0ABT1C892_9HYPH|nr:ABC transporter ATP-binding protein [Mesorhizobium liriopis]MCO6050371.1 ABC transporter ATP-binding protein [Mesorhizobium liriopis]